MSTGNDRDRPDSVFVLWIDRRRFRPKRGHGRQLPPIAAAENSWYRPGELLVPVEAERELAAALKDRLQARPYEPGDERSWRRYEKLRTPDLNEQLLKTSNYRLWVTRPDADDLPALTGELSGGLSPERKLALNTVLFGEPHYMGGPGSAPVPLPAPAAAPVAARASGTVLRADAALTVLDTGLPADWPTAPSRLAEVIAAGDVISPDETDLLDEDGNSVLDQQAAHGLFICGVANQIAPGIRIDPGKVLHAAGDGDEATIVAGMATATTPVINMSLGGYTEDDLPPPVMAEAVRSLVKAGKVVVAAAGNSGADPQFAKRPFWPAAFNDVIAVGAYDSATGEPADFTNRGPWVDVCAPGVDIASDFVSGWPVVPSGPIEFLSHPFRYIPRRYFTGWARWSGTSFAAPMVAAAIAQLVEQAGAPDKARSIADDFLAQLADSPWPNELGKIFKPEVDLRG